MGKNLLCLGEIEDADGYGDSLLANIESMLAQRWLPAGWAMSIGARIADNLAVPFEISLTRSPGFEGARVLAVGPDAVDA